jgi:hypothetical protein
MAMAWMSSSLSAKTASGMTLQCISTRAYVANTH